MDYYETTNYGSGDKRQCSRCGDGIPSGVPYMQSAEHELDSVCMDCFKGRKKPSLDQNSESAGRSEERAEPVGYWRWLLHIKPKEPKEKVITVEMQRRMAPVLSPPSKVMEEPAAPQTSTNQNIHNDGSLKQFATLIDELDAIDDEGEGMAQRGLGMQDAVTRLRSRLGIPSRASRRQKEMVRE